MSASVPQSSTPPKAPYRAPVLERFGSVAEQTKTRSMTGNKDGGAMSTRTG